MAIGRVGIRSGSVPFHLARGRFQSQLPAPVIRRGFAGHSFGAGTERPAALAGRAVLAFSGAVALACGVKTLLAQARVGQDGKPLENIWDDQLVPLSRSGHFSLRFQALEAKVDYLFISYFKGRQFVPWKPGRSDEELEAEFLALTMERGNIWFDPNQEEVARAWREDFKPAFNLIYDGKVRYPNCAAFEYNVVGPYYNGSLVTFSGMNFVALEGPSPTTLSRFFYTLLDTGAPLLVRLTPDRENGTDRCVPYWREHGRYYKLLIPRSVANTPVVIDYIGTDDWQDHSRLNVGLLLKLIEAARAVYDPAKGPLAVHCSAGVGRTGTFIAAYTLLQDIDAQLSKDPTGKSLDISIEKTVATLSLQRYYMVASPAQYVSLHRLVERYVAERIS